MSTTHPINVLASQTVAIDAFLAVARIYMTSTERLSELALATVRNNFEDCISASATAGVSGDLNAFSAAFGEPVLGRTIACSRASFEIVTQAHQKAAQRLTQELAPPWVHLPMSEDWTAGVARFTGGLRELSGNISANVTAATDAGSKLASDSDWVGEKAA